MPFKLETDDGARPLTQGQNVIGRTDEADICVDKTEVARCHAMITVQGTSAVIEDLGSKNGTYFNGRQIDGPTALNNGDEIWRAFDLKLQVEVGLGRFWEGGSDLLPSLCLAVADMEDLLEHDDGEDLTNLAAAAKDRQSPLVDLQPCVEPDQDPDPGAGQDGHPGEVKDDEPRLFIDQLRGRLPQLTRRIFVEDAAEVGDEGSLAPCGGFIGHMHQKPESTSSLAPL